MAEERRRARTTYQTSGNVAYQPRYYGSAAPAPRRPEPKRPEPRRHPQVLPRERVRQRPRVEVRQQGAVAPFAVAGFLTVAVFAVFLLVTCAQLAVTHDETVQLRAELDDLVTSAAVLQAEYELAYDLTELERQLTADGSMVRLDASQITYLDVSSPDNIEVYAQNRWEWTALRDGFFSLVSGLS